MIGSGTNHQAEQDHRVKRKGVMFIVWLSPDRRAVIEGRNILAPKQIGTGYSAIAAGDSHTMALKTDGSLWAWGSNLYGQLGDGTLQQSLVPKQIGTGFSKIAANYKNSAAIKLDGSLWVWGDNFMGQAGNGTTSGVTGQYLMVPTRITLP